MSRVAQRIEGFRFVVEDPDGFTIGDVHPEVGGQIQLETTREVMRTLTGLRLAGKEAEKVDPARHRIRVLASIGGAREVPLGLFRFTTDSQIYVGDSGWQLDGDLADLAIELDQPTGAALFVENVAADVAVTDMLAQHAPAAIVDTATIEGNSTQVSSLSWPPETSLLTALNDICVFTGYFPPYFDRYGILRVRRQVLASDGDAVVNWDMERVIDSAVITRDWLQTPTKWLVIASDEATGAVVGEYNLPVSHDMSAARRGFEVTKVMSTQGIISQEQAEAVARHEAAVDPDATQALSVDGLLDDRHDVFSIVEFNGVKWLERSWSISLSAGGRMSHRADRQVVA